MEYYKTYWLGIGMLGFDLQLSRYVAWSMTFNLSEPPLGLVVNTRWDKIHEKHPTCRAENRHPLMVCECHYVAESWNWAFVWGLWGSFESGCVKAQLRNTGWVTGLGRKLTSDVTLWIFKLKTEWATLFNMMVPNTMLRKLSSIKISLSITLNGPLHWYKSGSSEWLLLH